LPLLVKQDWWGGLVGGKEAERILKNIEKTNKPPNQRGSFNLKMLN